MTSPKAKPAPITRRDDRGHAPRGSDCCTIARRAAGSEGRCVPVERQPWIGRLSRGEVENENSTTTAIGANSQTSTTTTYRTPRPARGRRSARSVRASRSARRGAHRARHRAERPVRAREQPTTSGDEDGTMAGAQRPVRADALEPVVDEVADHDALGAADHRRHDEVAGGEEEREGEGDADARAAPSAAGSVRRSVRDREPRSRATSMCSRDTFDIEA